MSDGSRSRRRRPTSPAPAAPLPDNDDLLREILLRLPPLPSSLLRTSLVSKRWRRIISDPQFLRRFRAFHHRQAPLLGLLICDVQGNLHLSPTLDPPDRIPSARFSLEVPSGEGCSFLDCRHGLVLIVNWTRLEIIVWDPVTRDKRRVALPPAFKSEDRPLAVHGGALLCDDNGGWEPLESFKVVLCTADFVLFDAVPRAFAVLYESKADVWSNTISTSMKTTFAVVRSPILVGDSFYWKLRGYRGNTGILKFDLDRKNLAVIDTPEAARVTIDGAQVLRMEDSRLGLALLTEFSIHVWERKPNSDGGAKWMLQKTINLDKLLSLGSALHRSPILINEYEEDGNAIFVTAARQVFMIQLKSLQFKRLFKEDMSTSCHPFTSFYTTAPAKKSFYTTGRGIGSGDIGAEILNNT